MTSPLAFKIKREWLPLLIIAAGFILGGYFYQNFPDQVASHWNIEGVVDGYSGRLSAAFLLPTLNLVLYLMLSFLPRLDPLQARYREFIDIYNKIKLLMSSFLFVLYLLTGLNGLGIDVGFGLIFPVLIGALLSLVGYFIRDVKTNWFFGIRTPWTISSEVVWGKTAVFGSRLFMVSGVLIAASAFAGPLTRTVILILAITVMAIAPFIYSFIIYNQENKRR